jgi:hypothetical protein
VSTRNWNCSLLTAHLASAGSLIANCELHRSLAQKGHTSASS